jgi:hypothetical protein
MKTITRETFYGPESRTDGDSNALHIGPEQEPTHYVECTIDARAGAEALKITRGARQHRFTRCNIIGGYEDCVDILGAHNITFIDCTFTVLGRAMATIKGGARMIAFHGGVINGAPKHGAYFDLGGHTIYKHDRTITELITITDMTVYTKHRPMSLSRTWNATEPSVLDVEHPCYVSNFRIPKLIWMLYFYLRDERIL